MRTRQKSYKDYGLSKNDIKRVWDFCSNPNEKEKQIIKTALSELNPYIAPFIFYSLVDKLSYEEICAKYYIYMGKGDFYGYRRRGMESIKRWMILYGIWEIQR